MTLIIETGTGAANAEAYADAAAFVAWATAFDGAAPSGATTAIEAAIRRAVAYLDALRWVGQKTFGRVQARAWPRAWVTDRDGWDISANVVPVEVIEAQHMLTQAELASPGCLAPQVAAILLESLSLNSVLLAKTIAEPAPNSAKSRKISSPEIWSMRKWSWDLLGSLMGW